MLSPHEIAALMLVKASPDQIDTSSEEFDTLREQQLVELETLASGAHRLRMTHNGETLLRIVTQTY
ncbi:hypothetical protein DIE03_03275 [Burkholderia sp. Bp8992]|uniref:hypothetical protein n=1 Tax=unclassified Burkholderia TaxID=2613784 RepID=UPI000F57B5C4|nr:MULTISPECIES: hypothetical protein [unclassified Burkholderia]RQS36186.1 hypothetical protein DIE03_03275 [Burkholderia sp. Bp8992]